MSMAPASADGSRAPSTGGSSSAGGDSLHPPAAPTRHLNEADIPAALQASPVWWDRYVDERDKRLAAVLRAEEYRDRAEAAEECIARIGECIDAQPTAHVWLGGIVNILAAYQRPGDAG